MERLKELLNRFLFPISLILLGGGSSIYAQNSGQDDLFLIAGLAILGGGLILLIYAFGIINRTVNYILVFVLAIGVILMGYANYDAVKGEIERRQKAERMKELTIQGLKDIREIEVAYQERYGNYAASFDTLLHFLQKDSIAFVRMSGNRPDSLTEKEAIKKGLLQRDTLYTPVRDSLFNQNQERAVLRGDRAYPFIVDSLPYKRGTDQKFILNAGEVDQGGITRPVFMAKDPDPFSGDTLKVGDMDEPSKSGNWGDY